MGYRGELLIRFKYITQKQDVFKNKRTSTTIPMLTNVNMDKLQKIERIAQHLRNS